MNILSTQYTLATKSFEIYLSGCNGRPKCKGCYSPESWDFKKGKEYNQEYYKSIRDKVYNFSDLIDNIMILGGEPLDQNKVDFLSFLKDIRKLNKSMWLFTRYDLKEVPKEVVEIFDHIKCGKYLEELKTDNNIQCGIKLATSNQKIYKKGLDYNVSIF